MVIHFQPCSVRSLSPAPSVCSRKPCPVEAKTKNTKSRKEEKVWNWAPGPCLTEEESEIPLRCHWQYASEKDKERKGSCWWHSASTTLLWLLEMLRLRTGMTLLLQIALAETTQQTKQGYVCLFIHCSGRAVVACECKSFNWCHRERFRVTRHTRCYATHLCSPLFCRSTNRDYVGFQQRNNDEVSCLRLNLQSALPMPIQGCLYFLKL